MKKKSIAVILLLMTFVILACAGNESFNDEKKVVTTAKGQKSINNSGRIISEEKHDLISDAFFMYGVKSYEISDNRIIFETYRDFNVDGNSGNIADYKFMIGDNEVSLNDKEKIYVEDGVINLDTPEGLIKLDENFNPKKLSLSSKLLLIVFTEVNTSDKNKDTFDNISGKLLAGGGGCSWMNTYYVSGWGWTPGAAAADYTYNLGNGDLPGGKTCTGLGAAHLQENELELVVTTFHWYQVSRAFCCK